MDTILTISQFADNSDVLQVLHDSEVPYVCRFADVPEPELDIDGLQVYGLKEIKKIISDIAMRQLQEG